MPGAVAIDTITRSEAGSSWTALMKFLYKPSGDVMA